MERRGESVLGAANATAMPPGQPWEAPGGWIDRRASR